MAKLLPFLIAVSVAAMNIFIHTQARDSVNRHPDRLFSGEFVLAFTVGIFSLVCIFLYYRVAGINLASGLVVMGSASILGGIIFGMLTRRGQLSLVDLILLIAILACYISKIFK